MNENLPTEIKWRGSTYVLERVEEGEVFWFNSGSILFPGIVKAAL